MKDKIHKLGDMEYNPSGFHKYSNRFLPIKGVLFYSFENANIFSELLKLRGNIK